MAAGMLRYDELRTAPNAGEPAADRQNGAAAAALRGRGGALFGVWLPLVGLSINTVVVASVWDGDPPASPGAGLLETDAAVIGQRSRAFAPLARGVVPPSPARGGIHTHRWFVLREADVERLVALTLPAWEALEADSAARIEGLWRCRETEPEGVATLLMLVWYPSLAEWEATRFWRPKPAGAAQPNRDAWAGAFRQRRDLLLDSWVTVHRLVPPAPA
ncbi:hypothetical protein GCM10010964_26900 [Caldovatus sediminis]|uniref:Uncharacterized protein n=1 Tax=Caldovatus sediminis TaxID=2041189 RepID=A0A8J3ECZ3_9PROT|nr:hypothetical protein [Caldovatus sediminis]GGG37680.1 hypothetical protein GCM10010964_26900 [Caldovatus sediminis]